MFQPCSLYILSSFSFFPTNKESVVHVALNCSANLDNARKLNCGSTKLANHPGLRTSNLERDKTSLVFFPKERSDTVAWMNGYVRLDRHRRGQNKNWPSRNGDQNFTIPKAPSQLTVQFKMGGDASLEF